MALSFNMNNYMFDFTNKDAKQSVSIRKVIEHIFARNGIYPTFLK